MSDTGFFLLRTNKLHKKENTRRLKNFPAGYVGSFYRNLTDRVDTSSDFYAHIANDANIPKDDVQKYLLATSDFAKSMETDINNYVTKDRTNDASFRQKLDPISKNILRRQNPVELVFEDISTFDADNPIVGSLLREMGGTNLNLQNYGLHQSPPSLPTIENLIENGIPPPPPLPPGGGGQNISFSNNVPRPPTQNNFDILFSRPFVLPNIDNNGKIGNDLFGSMGAMAGPRAAPPEKPRQEIDDFLYELPDTGMPTLEIGDKLLDTLGGEAEDLFNNVPTKKEEEDEVLQRITDEYDIPGMKDTMDEISKLPENIYFFMVETVSSLLML